MKKCFFYRLFFLISFCALLSHFFGSYAQSINVTIEGNENIGCDCNGILYAEVQNGGPVYEYLWNTGSINDTISGLCAGNYSVTVIDPVLQDTASATLFLLDTCLSINIATNDSVTSFNCDGIAAAQISGGTGPYSFLWSTGNSQQVIDNLCPGTYCVTVSDANSHTSVMCTDIVEFIDNSCHADFTWLPAGSASCYETCYEFIDASVGANYSLNWSFGDSIFATSSNPVFSFTAYGNPQVCLTIFTSTCQDSVCEIIPVDSCQLSLDTVVTYISGFGACDGAVGILVQNGTSPYSMTWNTGESTGYISGLCDGNYCITVTDAFACKDSICVHLNNPPDTSCVASFTYSRTGLKQFEFSGLTSIGTVTSRYWDFGDMTFSTAPYPIHIFTSLGDYQVCLSIVTSTGCRDTVCQLINIDSCFVTVTSNLLQASCYGYCDGVAMLLPTGGTAPYKYEWGQPGTVYTQNVFNNLCAGSYPVTVTDADYCTTTSVIHITQPDTLISNAVITQISCYGECNGGATIVTSGGTPPYSYYLVDYDSIVTNSITNLCEGIYPLVVSDVHMCSNIGLLVINLPPNSLSIEDINYENVNCFMGNDGSAQIIVTGGTLPYYYQWSNGESSATIDSLMFGIYHFTVTDAHDCMQSGQVIVSQPGPINVSLTPTATSCHGVCNGSITGLATGGSSIFSFAWSNGTSGTTISSLCAGTYYTTVTDGNQCTLTAYTQVAQPDSLVTNITNVQHLTCHNICTGTASVSAYGGSLPYNILWSNGSTSQGISQVCAGQYNVVVQDVNGCQSSSSVMIGQPSNLELTINETDVSFYGDCDGNAYAIVTGGIPPYSYLWSDSSVSSSITNICTGTYLLSVTDDSSCTIVDSIFISSPIAQHLSGRVYAGTNFLPEGAAILYLKNPDGSYTASKIVSVENGKYIFHNLRSGIYLIYTIPYFDVGLQTPIYLPTYYGNKVFWSSASQIDFDSTIVGMDIFLAKNDNILYGQGFIGGGITYIDSAYYENAIYNQDWISIFTSNNKDLNSEPPARNIPVLLLSANNIPLDFVLTDSLGGFIFENIPYDTYRIYPEKAGCVTQTDTVSINSEVNTLTESYFSIHNKLIFRIADFIDEIGETTQINVYPVPFDDLLNFQIELPKDKLVYFKIMNTIGQQIYTTKELLYSGVTTLQVNTKGFAPGVYFTVVQFDNGQQTVIKIVK